MSLLGDIGPGTVLRNDQGAEFRVTGRLEGCLGLVYTIEDTNTFNRQLAAMDRLFGLGGPAEFQYATREGLEQSGYTIVSHPGIEESHAAE